MTPAERLARCLSDPGYTPARDELPLLLRHATSVGPDALPKLLRVLARSGAAAVDAALAELTSADDATRRAIYGLLGRLANTNGDARVFDALLSGLREASARERRAAASALGKLGDPRAEAALLATLCDAPVELARVVVEALGKLGGRAALAALESLDTSDSELTRRAEQARLLLARRLDRDVPAALVLDRALKQPRRVRFLCRRGLAEILVDELSARAPRRLSDAAVEITHAGTLAELFTARTALELALVIPVAPAAGPRTTRIAAALAEPQTRSALEAYTDGPLRVRLEWASRGHQREATWAVARELARLDTTVSSDPRAASWVVRIAPEGQEELLLLPQLDQDPRFSYRERDVPAASHPTLAAALARVLPPRADDVIWDPFVGSGLELIERAHLGSYARLLGTDIASSALDAARTNSERARVARLTLLQADALQHRPQGVTLILTNPPMGRRVARDGSLAELLRGFVAHAADILVPGGKLVWLSPIPKQTAEAARRHGLSVRSVAEIDMGGFSAELQILGRRET